MGIDRGSAQRLARRFGLAVAGFAVILAITAAVSGVAAAGDRKLEAMLRRLDPETRFEQICDLEAMKRISADKSNAHKPDRAMINAVSPPTAVETTMQGKGGAFRSRGQWYEFSFVCRTSDDHMAVLSFSYQLGPAIPKEKWESYGLWK
jgi:uncharacterized protein DUF930